MLGIAIALPVLSLALSLGGCGNNSSPATSETSQSLDGLSPDDAFAQFKYRVSGQCETGNLSFESVAFDPISVGRSGSGRETSGQLALYLRDEGTFRARYTEYETTPCNHGVTCHVRGDHNFWIDGRWSIRGVELVLEGLGRARYMTADSQPRLLLTVDSGFSVRGAASAQTIGGRVIGNIGERGQSAREECARTRR